MKKSIWNLLGSAGVAAMLVACASNGNGNSRSAGEVVDDTRILASAKAALLKDPEIKSTGIDVDVDHGAVTLKGVVRSDREKQKVLATVWGVKGVKSVQTDIKIVPPNP